MNRIFPLGGAYRFALAMVCVLAALPISAQTYPARPVTLITPFPPAGGTDVAARLFAQKLSDRLGQSVVVENRPGAGGNLGTALFARAAADGYTLLFTAQSPITIADSVSPKLGFNAGKDFVPVVLTQLTPVMVVVPASLPVRTMNDLAALSRATPGQLFFGSPGTGNELHLVGEWVKHEAKMDITHVPYKGSGPALTDLISGRTQMMIASPASVSQHIAEGRLRAIAILSQQRLPGFPGVPTAAESGYPQLVADAWFGLFAPAATPPAILGRLENEAAAIAAQASYQKQMSDRGMVATAIRSKEFREIIQKNRSVWGRLIPALNLTEDIYK